MTVTSTHHIPVMVNQVLIALRAEEGGAFLDCTGGGGGHSLALLTAHPKNRVTILERDPRACALIEKRLSEYADRFELKNVRFSSVVDNTYFHTTQFDGSLADLGMSTDQLKGERGFSFHDSSDLSMVMDGEGVTAREILNTSSEQELFLLFKRGGVKEEARLVARTIVKNRPYASATQLSSELRPLLLRRRSGEKRSDPCTVIFQALRMQVNDEINELEALLRGIPRIVKTSGRIVFLTFHSLEDQLVTRAMRQWQSGEDENLPRYAPRTSLGVLLTKKATAPSEDEIQLNAASRSARMRVFEVRKEQGA
jgi:16S rRNA (cytosine1402-N4)-methyltransferase